MLGCASSSPGGVCAGGVMAAPPVHAGEYIAGGAAAREYRRSASGACFSIARFKTRRLLTGVTMKNDHALDE